MSKGPFMEDYSGEDTRATLTQEDEYKAYLSDLQEVAKTAAGTRVLCRLLENLGTFEQGWHEKNAKLAKNAVLKDFGNDILDDLAVACEKVHDDIQRTMRIRRKLAIVLNTQI